MTSSTPPANAALPWRSVFLCALAYALVWVLGPAWLSHSFALDVTESLSWGKEWQWGYYKHPPLAPVVLNVFFEAFGTYGPYLLSQLCVALTLWAVWCTGCRLMDRPRAALGTLLTMGVTYYNFPAVEFNHNIAQMPLWGWLGYAFVAAVQDGKWRQWLALGVLAGLGLLTKYSVAVLLLAMGLYVLCCKTHRAVLRTPGPWVAVAVMVLVFLPHLRWLVEAEGLPFAYASGRAHADAGAGYVRLQALKFPLTQWLAHVPLLVVWALAYWRTRSPVAASQGNDASGLARSGGLRIAQPALLWALALLPCLLVTALGVVLGVRLRDMWGSPMWAFSGLLCMAFVTPARALRMQTLLRRGMVLWLVLVSLFMLVYLCWGAEIRKRPARMDWPAGGMGQQADQSWSAHSHCPLDTVAGDYWLTGVIAAASQDRPSVLIDDDPRFSPWVTAERLQRQGALWVWQAGAEGTSAPPLPRPLADVVEAAGGAGTGRPWGAVHEGVWHLQWPHAPQAAPLTLHWRAYVPQECTKP